MTTSKGTCVHEFKARTCTHEGATGNVQWSRGLVCGILTCKNCCSMYPLGLEDSCPQGKWWQECDCPGVSEIELLWQLSDMKNCTTQCLYAMGDKATCCCTCSGELHGAAKTARVEHVFKSYGQGN